MAGATGRGWWSDFRKSPLPRSAFDLAELEASAVAHHSFQWVYMPGLLQTEEYMRALFAVGESDAPPEAVDTYVEFRSRRHRILTENASPPAFHAIIHEAALHMEFVGIAVMRRQIEHLVALAQLPHVTIQILPFKAAVFPVQFSSPFVLFEGTVPELSTAYVEHPVSSPFIWEQPLLEEFAKAFGQLSTAALAPIAPEPALGFQARKDSLGLIQHLLYTM